MSKIIQEVIEQQILLEMNQNHSFNIVCWAWCKISHFVFTLYLLTKNCERNVRKVAIECQASIFHPTTTPITTYHYQGTFGSVTYLHILRVRTSVLRSLHCITQPAFDWLSAQLKQAIHAIAQRTKRVSIMIATLILNE